LVSRAEEIANYYNCHKVSVQSSTTATRNASSPQPATPSKAVIPQHTFKLDVALLRKFLL